MCEDSMSNILIPLVIIGIVSYGISSKVNVYDEFVPFFLISSAIIVGFTVTAV